MMGVIVIGVIMIGGMMMWNGWGFFFWVVFLICKVFCFVLVYFVVYLFLGIVGYLDGLMIFYYLLSYIF